MKILKSLSAVVLTGVFVFTALVSAGPAQTAPVTPKSEARQAAASRDGQHDFDWEFGTWNVKISRLQKPLTGSTTWTELSGTVVCRKIWDGKGNLAEVMVNGPSGNLEFLALRLYNPQTRQWTNTFSSNNAGVLSVSMYGEFKDGRGEFYDREEFNGRMILVRFIFIPLTADSGRSEQAFSDDGGQNWETNWINQYTRAKDKPNKSQQITKAGNDSEQELDFQ